MATIIINTYKSSIQHLIYDMPAAEAEAKAIAEEGNQALSRRVIEFAVPEIRGSEKQIAWAKEIRQQYMRHVAKLYPDMDDAKYAHAMEMMFGSVNARTYIDGRSSFDAFKALRRAEMVKEQAAR